MATILFTHPHVRLKLPTTTTTAPAFPIPSPRTSTVIVRASPVISPGGKTRRRRNSTKTREDAVLTATKAENSLRLVFMEDLMERARSRDVSGVSEVIYDMIAAGISPGPRSFHGLVVSHVLNEDHEGAMHALKRELSEGLCPLHETFTALIRLFGSKGQGTRGLEILAAMERLNYDIRAAWILLVEELIRSNHLGEANIVFLKGAEGGLRATNELYDLIIEEDCKVGDHSNALTIAYEMEAAGRMATTYHFNCLLSVQATCGMPEIALETFENMAYDSYGEDYMKPDTESYNYLIQAYTRAESFDRAGDVAEILAMMIEDHKRVQPNARTHALLVECFTKYDVVGEAIRHFRALQNFNGGTIVLHNEGNHGDPLSLYLRSLCCEGRIVELLEALEAMAKDNQSIPSRAMIVNRKYRTLVSSWIEPLHEEADLGFEIDYIARYVAEGGLIGERKRWVPKRTRIPLDPDALGFKYDNPIETSLKQRCVDDKREHYWKLLTTLRNEGRSILGDVSRSDYDRVEERLMKLVKGPNQNALKPKAASKMTVPELKEELEAQDLPTDGTRNVLYQRVQKARRINRSRGRPLWVRPVDEEEEEVDEELDELISRIKLEEGNTEFFRRRFLGEGINGDHGESIDVEASEPSDVQGDGDIVEDVVEEIEDDEVDQEEEEEEVEQTEREVGDIAKDKDLENGKPLQMIGYQLLKDADPSTASTKSSKKVSQMSVEDDDDEEWFPMDIHGALKELTVHGGFGVSDMYTIADVWGWTWERELKKIPPRRWSQEWEVELAMKLLLKVIELGGIPTIGDCAMIVRAAIRAPFPSAFLKILQTTHSLGYVFGSPLYNEIITVCLDTGELDAAIAIVADLETTGITVPDETLDRVISARQITDSSIKDTLS